MFRVKTLHYCFSRLPKIVINIFKNSHFSNFTLQCLLFRLPKRRHPFNYHTNFHRQEFLKNQPTVLHRHHHRHRPSSPLDFRKRCLEKWHPPLRISKCRSQLTHANINHFGQCLLPKATVAALSV